MSKKLRKAFGRALREIRKKRGLSQLEISTTSDLDRAYVSELENGLKNPSLETIYRLADAMEIPAVDLIKKTTEMLD
ncbi:MAG TPA: helix-turn-helix transcriptional regulator [Acidobacteriaceae bacterium]|nr:helix-turn-helix transcriptional regulator [Acidobacteriaceae bacterium]